MRRAGLNCVLPVLHDEKATRDLRFACEDALYRFVEMEWDRMGMDTDSLVLTRAVSEARQDAFESASALLQTGRSLVCWRCHQLEERDAFGLGACAQRL